MVIYKKKIGRVFITLEFIWYDIWVGFYINTMYGKLYICILPMLPIAIQKIPRPKFPVSNSRIGEP